MSAATTRMISHMAMLYQLHIEAGEESGANEILDTIYWLLTGD